MAILAKSGRFSEDLAFAFHFGAVLPCLLLFHVFYLYSRGARAGAGVWGGTQAIISAK